MARRVMFLLAVLLATILLAGCSTQDMPVEQAEEEAGIEEVVEDTSIVVSTLIGALIGGALSLAASWFFYRKASRDLNHKVKRLEKLITLIALYLERDGILKDVEIENGILKGYEQTIHAGFVRSEPKVHPPTVTLGDPPEEPKEANGD